MALDWSSRRSTARWETSLFPFVLGLDTAAGRATSSIRLPLPPALSGAEMTAWSPAGEEIAIEEAMPGGRHALWVIRSDGTAARKLVDYPMRTYGGVDWTPDGKTLIYTALSGIACTLRHSRRRGCRGA